VRRIPAWGLLAALVGVSTIVRAWAGLRIPTPWIAADEMIYSELGRSLWETGRLEILGADTPFYSLVHPALIGLPLAVFDTAPGYDVARVLQALVMSLTAVPVFLWGRRLMDERWALVAATLTLALPAFAYSGLLMTETVFLPAMTLAAWAAASALERPTPRAQALLVGAVALAVLTRLQALVLVPAVLLAAILFAASERSPTTLRRLAPALIALVVLAVVWSATVAFGAYGLAGETQYDVGDAARFVLYHAADAVFFTGVVPACAVAFLLLRPPASPAVRAYLAVTVAVVGGLVLEVGVFASRYVGRLAERDLLAVAPLLFLGLALWADLGAPRGRWAKFAVPLAAAALVLSLPLGRLVHRAALPDALTFVPMWESEQTESLVWGFTTIAVLVAAFVSRRTVVATIAALAVVLVTTAVFATRLVEREASKQRTSFFGSAASDWVDRAAQGDVAYLYDGDIYWNAVWSYVFSNRDVRRVYVLESARRIPGPLPQTRVDPFPFGELDERPPPYVVASTALTFAGTPVASVDQVGLFQRGLVLWRVDPPLRVRTILAGVQGSGDIYGPASLVAYDCNGGTFELTLIAKGSPVTVRLDTRAGRVERTLAAEEVWRPSVPAVGESGVCAVALTPSGLVGSTRFEYVR
jgi:4-amino-4-deoxy-L-arabinose transferase-like glycosyltransferase